MTMAFKILKPSYSSALNYLTHQQQYEINEGGMQLLNRRFKYFKSLNKKDLYAHYGCVNAIEFSNDGQWMISGGDDKRVLIWNMSKTLTSSSKFYQPTAMKSEHNSNIFCLAFNQSHSKLLSAGNDEQVILHDITTKESLDVFPHQEAVYGLSADPSNDSLFATSCDDGRVLIWDIRQSTEEPLVLTSNASAYHAVMHNPIEPQFLATANAKEGVCLWDIRKPSNYVMKYGSSLVKHSAMSVRFNAAGNQLLALRRRLPPVLYDVTSAHHIAEFDHPEYYNSCTMKSCCFAGERDQYVLSGSDDFKLYVWEIPNKTSGKGYLIRKTHFVLKGHRSIVNQVRYNNTYGIIASSGVEKIIKLWSTFQLSHSEETDTEGLRKVYSHEEYINLVLQSGQFMTHDYSHHSTREDPRMMAFFDSLVQRDIEGWTSDSNDASERTTSDGFCFEVQSSDDSTTTCSSSSSEDELEDFGQSTKRTLSGCLQDRPDSSDIQTRMLRLHSFFGRISTLNPPFDQDSIPNDRDISSNISAALEDSFSSRPANNRELVTTSLASNEIGASRRLFSDREGIGGRLITDNGTIRPYFSIRDGATSRLFANREEAASWLLSNRQVAANNFNSTDNNEEGSPTSDRISQLIAQKRRIHILKSARKSMSRENALMSLKPFKRTSRISSKKLSVTGNEIGFRPLCIDRASENSTSLNNRIKLLRKKRAQLNKIPKLEANSSESEDNALSENISKDITSIKDDSSVSKGIKRKNEKSDNSINLVNNLFLKHSKSFKKVAGTSKDNVQSLDLTFRSDSSNNSAEVSKIYDLNLESDKSASCSGIKIISKNKDTSVMSKSLEEIETKDDLNSSSIDTEFCSTESSVVNGDKSISTGASEKTTSIIGSTNGNLTEAEISVPSDNSSFCFPISVVRHGRNYRKRSVDSTED